MKKYLFAFFAMFCMLLSLSAFAAEDIVWDFDDNTVQSWTIGNVDSHSVENGVLKLNLSETVGDAQIKIAANVSTSDYRYIAIDMKHNIPDENMGTHPLEVFFKLSDGSWKQSHSVNTELVSASDSFNTYVLDLGSNASYSGTVAALRIDPVDTMSTADATYTVEIDKITFMAEKDVEIIEWNFDDNTTQGWQSSVSGTLSAENGALKVLLHNTNNDVYVYISNQSIDTSVYKYAVVYMKHNVPESAWDSTPFQFLFYNTNSSWWANMLVNIDRKPASDNYEEYIFNMGSNKYWTGIIPRLRFDPFQITAPTLGDYVVYVDKIVMCPEIKLTLDYGFDDVADSTYAIPGGISHSLAGYDEPVYEGYRFLGWVDADGNAVTSVNSVGDTTVYASWKATSPSITLTDKYAAVANLESDAVFVLSGYDIYGRITDTVTKPVSSDYSVSIADCGLDISKVKTVKAFLFDDMTTLKPLCKEKSTMLYMFDYAELEGEEYGFVGRWFDYEHSDGNTYKATITPGAEMYFKVSGTTKVDFKLNCNDNLHDVPYIAVSVDGSAPTRISTHRKNAKTIVSGLDPDKEHVIRIVVDSFSSAQGTRWTEGNGLIFDKVIVDEGGTITGLMPKNPVIAYYGDSITEGLAALSTEGQGMYTTSSSAINAYPFTASHLIGAVSHTSGYGSTGITIEKGLGNVPNCITVIDNMIQDTPIVMPELDAIVVNHGHNDLNASVSDEDFAVGYKEVLVRLREKHPGVPIFAVVPYAQRYVETIKSVVEELDDENIYYISTAGWEYTTTDGVHPDAAGGEKLGTRLAAEIAKYLK